MFDLFNKNKLPEIKPNQNESKPRTIPEYDLERKMKSGYNWFYWIAGLSAVNSIAFFSGQDIFFVAGLGTTLVINILLSNYNYTVTINYIINPLLIGLFAVFGYTSRKNYIVAIIGVVLYSLDSLIFLWFQDWWSFGFHVFAIINIIIGIRADLELTRLRSKEIENNSGELNPE